MQKQLSRKLPDHRPRTLSWHKGTVVGILYLMQHLYLMRHGQSDANAHHIVAGSHDSPLSALGEQQAGYAGGTARLYVPIDLIVSSPMKRALQTAQIVANEVGYSPARILVINELRERNLGDVEGKNYSQALQHNGNYEDAENVPGVEPIESLFDRVAHALQIIRTRPESNVLIVCHNGCGRMLRVVAEQGVPLDMYKQPRLENAVFYQLTPPQNQPLSVPATAVTHSE